MATSEHAIPRPPSGAGSLLLVAALVVGVLGMHALSTACGHSGDATVTVAAPDMHHAMKATAAPPANESGSRAAPDVRGDGGTFGDPMSICLAVLLAIGSLLLALALRRSVRGWRVARVRTPRMPCLSATARPRPPPSLTRLSILRC